MKKTIDDIKAEYRRLDALCGVDTRYIPIRISSRAVKRYGSCSYRCAGKRCFVKGITISDFILECDEQFWDTIRHEYAHALCVLRTGKNHGHDTTWKAACREIGCNPDRLARNEEAHAKSVERRLAREKYEVKCLDCQRVWRYVKAGPVVKMLRKGSKKCTCPCGSHNFSLFYLNG